MQSSLIRRRPIIAGLLGFLYPGLGHIYLRAWLRAIAWFALALVTAAMVVPESAVTAFQQTGIDGLISASQDFSLEVTGSLLVVRVLNVVDAYLTGLRQERATDRQASSETPTCPNCGGELDAELDFCPWCTTELSELETEVSPEEDEGPEGLPFR
ncbi:Membrane protein containing Zn-ribbon domain [Halanaeroarchaeum sp. HSR-CO]|uniref:zinc ribbon domain-containing protein n=1 Tax=Halanaeroarchaeum sp. HSR-CO TaxID=2866382 RepID=UPI00217EEFE9|nr:zinc ribbon domain-containing protein [Halanaeroarchaeum sp. HSR-CO]UWG47261.1 Membrane protein containing Zn-ribbon domain [Halanaeroarchaeum sp. HSR-CO]